MLGGYDSFGLMEIFGVYENLFYNLFIFCSIVFVIFIIILYFVINLNSLFISICVSYFYILFYYIYIFFEFYDLYFLLILRFVIF